MNSTTAATTTDGDRGEGEVDTLAEREDTEVTDDEGTIDQTDDDTPPTDWQDILLYVLYY